MGLDARVYCNCFETGALREPPPCDSVFVSADGGLDCRNEDLETLKAFDQWVWNRACIHPSGILLHHRIGNIAQVALVRGELQRETPSFPILLTRVIYNGIHGGDYLTVEDIGAMEVELERLRSFVCAKRSNQVYVDWFWRQMSELAEAAKSVGKPISF
jgi:hypothetical protein